MGMADNSKDFIFNPYNLGVKLYDFFNKLKDVLKFQ